MQRYAVISLIFVIVAVALVICAPVQHFQNFAPPVMGHPYFNNYNSDAYRPRPLTDWIMSIEWLPIEINVPDMIRNLTSNFQNTAGSFVQRIPFINRFVSQERPRPLPYVILLPVNEVQDNTKYENFDYNNYNSLDDDINNILPLYP